MFIKQPPVWAVMVPIQADGGGEWVMPEIPVWFGEKAQAVDWAKNWAMNDSMFTYLRPKQNVNYVYASWARRM